VLLVNAEGLVGEDEDGRARSGEATDHLDHVLLLGLRDLWTKNAEEDVEESVNEQFSVNIITKENPS